MPGQWTKVDQLGGLATIDWAHHEVHAGEMYIVSQVSTVVANDAALSFGTNGPMGVTTHFTYDGECGGDAFLELWEYPSATGFSTAGTTTASTVAYNMRRNVATTISVIKNSSYVSSSGIPVARTFLPGGKGPQAAGGGAGTRPGLEFITDPTKHYLVRIVNKAGANKPAGLTVNFYVEE